MRQNDIVYRQGNAKLTFTFLSSGNIEIEVSMDTENGGELIEDIFLERSDVTDIITEWLKNI